MSLHVRRSYVFPSVLWLGFALSACGTDDSEPAVTGGTAGAPGGSGNAAGSTGGSQTPIGGGGAGGGSEPPSTMSTGCGKDSLEDPTEWNAHDVEVVVDPAYAENFSMRTYFTRPPATYDKNTPAVLTIWGQGCGQTVAENTPLSEGPAADGSIQLQLLADPDSPYSCYSAGPDGDDPRSPELPYFDEVLAEVLDTYCIDTTKIFMGGYSSGGWLTALVSCNRASVVRGVGWAAAGLQLNHDACEGPVAAIINRGVDDEGTPLDQTEAARNSLLLRNGCGHDTMPWEPGETEFDSSSCVEYQGCMPGYPVVWCPTPGGHSNGLDTGLSSHGFWKLWTSLP